MLLCTIGVAMTNVAVAAGPGRQLASACAGCHLVEPKDLTEPTAIPALTGLSEADIVRRMLAYRADEKSSQVMHVVAGALSPEEIVAVAHYIAAQQSADAP
jgi:cytochrome c553